MYQTRLTLKNLLLGLAFALTLVAAPTLSGPAHAGDEGADGAKARVITQSQPDMQTQEKSLRQPDMQTQEKILRQPDMQTQEYDWSDD